MSQPQPAVTSGQRRTTPAWVLDFSDRPARIRPRTSVLEWIGLVLAIIVPPLGLLVTIIARIVTRYRHHWTTSVAKAATAISIVLTLVLAGGAVVYSTVSANTAADARVVAAAQPLCTSIEATPGVLELDAYGWPTEVAPIADTLLAMQAYEARWKEAARIAPASAKAGTAAIADQAAILVSAVQVSQAIDRTANLRTMKQVTDVSGLPQYVATYCN